MIKGEGMKKKGLELLKNDTFIVLLFDIIFVMIYLVNNNSLLYKKLMLEETSC